MCMCLVCVSKLTEKDLLVRKNVDFIKQIMGQSSALYGWKILAF